MRDCPNCGKSLNSNFTYCYCCGFDLDKEALGDFKTSYLNVFKNGDEFIYAFAVNGKQVILKSSTITELKMLVELNQFPWMEIEN